MRTQSSKNTERKISIDELTIGMYVATLDVSWFKTPFLFHKRLIRQSEDITSLKEFGVQIVTIDLNQGKDAPEPEIPSTVDSTECTPATLGLDPAPPQEPKPNVKHTKAPSYEEARAVRAEATVAVQKIFEGVKNGMPIDGPTTKIVVDTLLQNILDSQNFLLHLLHMRHYDVNLYAHSVDVCSLALLIGRKYGVDTPRLKRLGVGALLHDIGLMRLPRNVLRKQGAYTDHERKLMEVHPSLGVTILSQVGGIHEESVHIVAEHHERCNGSGYPNRRRAPDISVMTQIVGIADMYDAMLSSRGRRIPLQPAQAVRQLYQAGVANDFDMQLVQAIVGYLGIYPVGSLLELTTGEHAVVVELNPAETLHPYVKLISDHKGEPYVTPRVVSLGVDENGGEERAVQRILDQ
jgi:putative nucleotidyltransferase with HDIG domain